MSYGAEANLHIAFIEDLWDLSRFTPRYREALAWLSHIPSGEERAGPVAAKLYRMGARAGWPDLLLVEPRTVRVEQCDGSLCVATAPGLALELKAGAKQKLSEDQAEFLARLHAFGWAAVVLRPRAAPLGPDIAHWRQTVVDYLEGCFIVRYAGHDWQDPALVEQRTPAADAAFRRRRAFMRRAAV